MSYPGAHDDWITFAVRFAFGAPIGALITWRLWFNGYTGEIDWAVLILACLAAGLVLGMTRDSPPSREG